MVQSVERALMILDEIEDFEKGAYRLMRRGLETTASILDPTPQVRFCEEH